MLFGSISWAFDTHRFDIPLERISPSCNPMRGKCIWRTSWRQSMIPRIHHDETPLMNNGMNSIQIPDYLFFNIQDLEYLKHWLWKPRKRISSTLNSGTYKFDEFCGIITWRPTRTTEAVWTQKHYSPRLKHVCKDPQVQRLREIAGI